MFSLKQCNSSNINLSKAIQAIKRIPMINKVIHALGSINNKVSDGFQIYWSCIKIKVCNCWGNCLHQDAVYWDACVYTLTIFFNWMGFDREAKRHFLIILAFSVESCIFDSRMRAVSQLYINRSRQIDVNWSRVWHGVGLLEDSCICESGTVFVS